MKEQTNPTEIIGNWQAAGDDAAGFYSVKFEYDWKGRVTKTINQDNTFKTAEYGGYGCGCAGYRA